MASGIVSVWAAADGRAIVWRRVAGDLVREEERFRPWVLLDRVGDLPPGATVRELDGPGALRYLVTSPDGRALRQYRDLGKAHALVLPPEEQFLVATGRTYFRGLAFDDLRRMQFDLETTGLDAEGDRIFLIAVRDPSGAVDVLEGDERDLIARLVERVRAADPDVLENHNLHGFDLPFLECRARILGVPLALGRTGPPGLRQRGWRRGSRLVVPGRECIDTLDAVLRYDFATRELPEHGLKAVARHLGIAAADREYIAGERVYEVYRADPARVRRYAASDVVEVAALAKMLGGAAFALAQMTPRRYERLADAGAATGVIDPLLVRAYLRAGAALPAHQEQDGTPHTGASLHLFAAGVARRVVKADVASLYPSLMRAHRIGPARDRLGAMLGLVDRLVERRLAAKKAARAAPPGSAERYRHEAMSAAMKLVVNSAYGYLAAGGSLTRFADVHAANEVTRRGRETLDLMCRELAARGVTLLEADTDGVYFSVPEHWTEADERRAVAEVAALLPPLVHLEFEGRYAAMLSHEPKNYALLGYDAAMVFKGVAFRSSRAEPFGQRFLRRAVERLLVGDVAGVREIYLETLDALRRHEVSTYDVSSHVRLTKSPEQYRAVRDERRELAYEAMLACGRTSWSQGDRARVYRTRSGAGGVIVDDHAPRDYDVEHYARILRDLFASRLARAFAPDDYAAVFADPDQLSLFASPVEGIRTVLTPGR
jgi:DNA polymerase elongation subunit (family B)